MPLEGHYFSCLTLMEQSSISVENQQRSEEELSCVMTFFQLEMNHFNNGKVKINDFQNVAHTLMTIVLSDVYVVM